MARVPLSKIELDEDEMIVEGFEGELEGIRVWVTAVLERTCVYETPDLERRLVSKSKILVDKDAMRRALGSVDMKGTVVIGEGEKDEAPMLYFGEEIGNGLEPEVDVAVDPIDGTEFTANGLPGAMSVVALAERGSMFSTHVHYMEKLVVGRRARGVIDIDMPVEWNLRRIAKAEGHHPRDLTVIILDRERNRPIIEQVRAVGPRISLISGGDVAAAVAAANDQLTGKHVLMGSGGATEGVLAACAVKCLRGDMQARFYFRDDDERQPVVREGPQ